VEVEWLGVKFRLGLLALLLVAAITWVAWARSSQRVEKLPVGVVFSQTGTMARSEKPLLDATLLAIEQINANGGIYLKGERRVLLDPIVVDGGSTATRYAQAVEELVKARKLRIFFGCWTSDSRKAVTKVIQPVGGLLFYPVQFEGQEVSNAVVYSGLSANQQLFPALDYMLRGFGSKVFLVGSDYVYPRTSNVLARQYLLKKGGRVVGERYRPLAARDFDEIVEQIERSGCDFVLNTINGESLNHFFRAYQSAGIQPSKTPIMSLSLGESRAADLGDMAVGHYTTWGYFMALNNPANRRFLKAFRHRYGESRMVDDPCETAYWQVYAFAQAVERVGDYSPTEVRRGLRALILDTPGGLVRFDPRNLYCWRTIRVGQSQPGGQMRVVWSTEVPLKPEPFPEFAP